MDDGCGEGDHCPADLGADMGGKPRSWLVEKGGMHVRRGEDKGRSSREVFKSEGPRIRPMDGREGVWNGVLYWRRIHRKVVSLKASNPAINHFFSRLLSARCNCKSKQEGQPMRYWNQREPFHELAKGPDFTFLRFL